MPLPLTPRIRAAATLADSSAEERNAQQVGGCCTSKKPGQLIKRECFTRALFVVTSTAVISVYKQLTAECSASSTSHIKPRTRGMKSALDQKINYTLEATAKLYTDKK